MQKRNDIDTVLFDFFGTLVSYKPGSFFKKKRKKTYEFLVDNGLLLNYEDWANLYTKIYRDETVRAQKTKKEFHMHTVMKKVLQNNIDWNIDEAFVEEATKIYVKEWSEDVYALKNIHELLSRLVQRYKLGIISNTQYPSLIVDNLQRLRMDQYFLHITTSVAYGKRKPHQSIFKETLKKMNAKKDKTIFVGDNYEEDYLGARNTGLSALLIDASGEYKTLGKNRLQTLNDLAHNLAI